MSFFLGLFFLFFSFLSFFSLFFVIIFFGLVTRIELSAVAVTQNGRVRDSTTNGSHYTRNIINNNNSNTSNNISNNNNATNNINNATNNINSDSNSRNNISNLSPDQITIARATNKTEVFSTSPLIVSQAEAEVVPRVSLPPKKILMQVRVEGEEGDEVVGPCRADDVHAIGGGGG